MAILAKKKEKGSDELYQYRGDIVTVNSEAGEIMNAPVLLTEEVRGRALEVSALHHLRLPVMRESGEIELLSPGYDAASKVYTFEGLPYDDSMSINAAKEFFETALAEFPWGIENDDGGARTKGAHYAAMLGVFCRTMFAARVKKPRVVYTGRFPGCGKTTLAEMALAPVHGAPTRSKPDEGQIKHDGSYMFLDDVGGVSKDINSAFWMGSSESQLFVTGDRLHAGVAAERHSLVVDLYEVERPRERAPKAVTQAWLFAPETRSTFCAALWAMVREWNAAGRPESPVCPSNGFAAWSGPVAGILHNYDPSLTPFAERLTGAADYDFDLAVNKFLCVLATGLSATGEKFSAAGLYYNAKERGWWNCLCGYGEPNPGCRLRGSGRRELVDEKGRAFEFVEVQNGMYDPLEYEINFLDDASE